MRIRSKRVYINESIVEATIEIENTLIKHILPYDSKNIDIDYDNNLILPGFIDIHTHGGYGYDVNSADASSLSSFTKSILKEGITSFLPTTITDTKDNLKNILKCISYAKENHIPGKDGADIIGIHLEGPYINEEYAGAQLISAIANPNIEEFKEYINDSNNLIRIITLAPEKDVNHELIKYCATQNIIASIGHTAATFIEASEAVKDGAKSITHTFNAQTGFHHRNNGVVGVALRNSDLYSEIICDTHHVSSDALNIFYKCKDKDHAIMISDSLVCKGFEVGYRFKMSNQNVEIYDDGIARFYETKEKTIAGSTMKMNEGLKNVIEKADVPILKAINSCTINPARLLSLDKHIGLIKPGYDADIVILDNDYSVINTFSKGYIY